MPNESEQRGEQRGWPGQREKAQAGKVSGDRIAAAFGGALSSDAASAVLRVSTDECSLCASAGNQTGSSSKTTEHDGRGGGEEERRSERTDSTAAESESEEASAAQWDSVTSECR